MNISYLVSKVMQACRAIRKEVPAHEHEMSHGNPSRQTTQGEFMSGGKGLALIYKPSPCFSRYLRGFKLASIIVYNLSNRIEL